MTLEDLEKIVNDKIAFQGNEKFEKYTELTDRYLALTGITQLAGGKTIEELLEDASDEEKETIIGKLAWCIPGGKGMGGDDSGPKSEVDVETETYTAEEAAAYNLKLEGALQYGAVKTPAVEAVEAKPAIYSFASFGVNDDAPYGTGTVEVISQDLVENVTTVKVLTNEPAGNTTAEEAAQFVNKQYFVHATELGAEKYTLYSDGGLETPIYVTVKLVSEAVAGVEAQDAVLYTNEEVDAYNAQLIGAVKEGDTKPKQS